MKNKKEINTLLVGLGLIALVIIITIVRGVFFSNKNETPSEQSENQAETETGQKYQTISPNELNSKIGLKTKLNLLDIRSFEEYSAEHIIDSINVPVDELPAGSKIVPENPVIIITTDLSDKNIDTVLKSLNDEHITDIKVLAGGITAWKNLIGSTISFGDPKSFVDQSKVSYVQPEKLNEALKNNVATFILDVRDPQEYQNEHIKGAVNIPFEELEKRRNELRQFPRIVVTGINELQEFQASVQLYDMIFTQPFVLKGGVDGWKKKGFEMVK